MQRIFEIYYGRFCCNHRHKFVYGNVTKAKQVADELVMTKGITSVRVFHSWESTDGTFLCDGSCYLTTKNRGKVVVNLDITELYK